jgi:AhpD family alkylhydroperoxidase
MTTNQQNLSSRQKELVAVGASVGAGCHPCVAHHLKAGAKAGLDGEQLLAAVTSAERVAAEAAVALGDHARAKLGPEVTSPALLSRLEEALASLGAALGANDATNIERQLRAAAGVGASRAELQQAIETAHTVQENAARIHLREAERLLDAVAPAAVAADGATQPAEGCSRGPDDADEAPPSEAEAPTRPAASSSSESGNGCCGGHQESEQTPGETGSLESAAAHFGAAGASGSIAECGRMLRQFIAGAAPRGTPTAPAATAAGPCTREA